MKNIHILPTTEASRLAFDIDDKFYLLSEDPVFFQHQDEVENRNIYITSDEEIGEGDWYYTERFGIGIAKNEGVSKIERTIDSYKKIILTTYPNLIADGVQAIDDEFLEWFVENPTCEFVEVTRDFADEGVKGITHYGKYFITIPQEDKNNENTTLNDIITNTLKGKSVIVYEYDALFVLTNNFVGNNRRISHWYINDNEENRIQYGLKTHWDDLQIKKHVGTIVSVSGYHMDYEGTSITMVVNVDGNNKHINLHMENTMELVS